MWPVRVLYWLQNEYNTTFLSRTGCGPSGYQGGTLKDLWWCFYPGRDVARPGTEKLAEKYRLKVSIPDGMWPVRVRGSFPYGSE